MIRRLQTKHQVRPHGMDPTRELFSGPELELVAVADGQRRDVLVKREGYADFLVYDGNIAGIEVEQILPGFEPEEVKLVPDADAVGSRLHGCRQCEKSFLSDRALKGHMARVHR